MKGRLTVVGRFAARVPEWLWRLLVSRRSGDGQSPLALMTPEHPPFATSRYSNYPPGPAARAQNSPSLGLPLPVAAILDDLERHLTFLYRNPEGAVAWAYPVTVEPTPHRVTLNGKSASTRPEGSTRWRRPSCKGSCEASRSRCWSRRGAPVRRPISFTVNDQLAYLLGRPRARSSSCRRSTSSAEGPEHNRRLLKESGLLPFRRVMEQQSGVPFTFSTSAASLAEGTPGTYLTIDQAVPTRAEGTKRAVRLPRTDLTSLSWC